MSGRIPLTLDYSTGGPQQLPRTDTLDEGATGLTAQERFDDLEQRHQLLVALLMSSGLLKPHPDLQEDYNDGLELI